MHHQTYSLKNIAILLIGLSFTASLFLFVSSLSFVGIGHWPQSEGAISLFCALGFSCSLGLFLLSASGHKNLVVAYVKHPAVLIFLGIAFVSSMFAPLTPLPVRSFLGSPQIGEGVLWWLNAAIFTLSALILCRIPIYKKLLGFAAISSTAVCFGLCLAYVYLGNLYAPFYFPDFNAFQLICLLPILYGLLSGYIKDKQLWIGLYIALLPLMYLSQNHIGLAFAALGFLYFLILWFLLPLRPKLKSRIGFATLTILPIFVLAFSAVVLSLPAEGGFYDYIKYGSIQTIFSRAYLVGMAIKPMLEHPISILIGQGWGVFDEHIILYIPTEWLDLTLKRNAQWDGLTTDHFHSHNIIVETFSAAGILAALLIYSLFLAIPFAVKKHQRFGAFVFSAGLASLTAFWFTFALHIPFIALAIGYMSMRPYKKSAIIKFFRPALPAVLVVIGLLQLSGAIATFLTAKSTHQYIATGVDIKNMATECPNDYHDFGAGGLHLAMIMTQRLRYISWQASKILESSNPQETIDDMKEGMRQVNHLFCQSSHYIENNPASARLHLARLLIRSEALLSLGTYLDQQTLDYYYAGWKEDLQQWLGLAPTRTDQAVPFFLWHILNNREDVSKSLIYSIYAHNPDDPVGLWFKGLYLTKNPRTASEGLNLMKNALDKGIERFMPVDEKLKSQLQDI